MNVAASLYGSLSGAEPERWACHLDSLLAIFTHDSRGVEARRLICQS
jgi:hypothetical protein